mmetsp:Transcript_85705/g.188177  ORF Transcript_85705/g.188177 Transcript_85705/m.188177 type:complete len:227 (+) Transcript_85705:1-681(+)
MASCRKNWGGQHPASHDRSIIMSACASSTPRLRSLLLGHHHQHSWGTTQQCFEGVRWTGLLPFAQRSRHFCAPALHGDQKKALRELRRRYLLAAKLIHPDANPGKDSKALTVEYQKLSADYEAARQKIINEAAHEAHPSASSSSSSSSTASSAHESSSNAYQSEQPQIKKKKKKPRGPITLGGLLWFGMFGFACLVATDSKDWKHEEDPVLGAVPGIPFHPYRMAP